ncbi:MAG TPA: hypothetical protein VFR18_10605 [Terriglobia bacterium]|nr:hypothetical protein [Terriglobia bacterium]
MNRFAWIVLLLVVVTPAVAQDDGDEGLFDVNDIFGDNSSGQIPPKVDPVVEVRNWLTRANAPVLEKKQESPLKKVYERELKALSKPFEKRFGVSLESAIALQAAARGRRGATVTRANAGYVNEVRRISEQLFDKTIAALRIDQQGALRRYQSEQLRVIRQNAMVATIASVGVTLTTEQRTQLEALYARESRLRTLIIVESKGEPHRNKVASLEAETNERVNGLLDESQKAALAEGLGGSNSR